jgi:hypothetical protein
VRGRARAGDTNERALEGKDDRVKKRENKVPLLGGFGHGGMGVPPREVGDGGYRAGRASKASSEPARG